jgi:hypothetical protein
MHLVGKVLVLFATDPRGQNVNAPSGSLGLLPPKFLRTELHSGLVALAETIFFLLSS